LWSRAGAAAFSISALNLAAFSGWPIASYAVTRSARALLSHVTEGSVSLPRMSWPRRLSADGLAIALLAEQRAAQLDVAMPVFRCGRRERDVEAHDDVAQAALGLGELLARE
jgi:hypothetical protein